MAQKPAKKIQLGSIRATIWENASDKGASWFNVELTRSYKDGDEFKDSTSFSHNDLPVVSKAIDFAYQWIWNQKAKSGAKSKNGS
jgi:hypothetical protein